MANPIQFFYSDLVLGKVDSSDAGYSFLEMDVEYADGLVAGTVVTADGTPAEAGDDVFGVIVDRELIASSYTPDTAYKAGETYSFVVGVRGLTLNKSALVFADGSAIDDAAIAALEAKGLKITDKYFDGSEEIPVTAI